MGAQSLQLDVAAGEWLDVVVSALRSGGVSVGDTVLLGLHDEVTGDRTGEVLASGDVVMRRSDTIWDIYASKVGAALLEACDANRRPHHTQLRWFPIGGHQLVQVAIYPEPLTEAGVRVWCDPALIVLFVHQVGLADVRSRLIEVQPLWERLRAHHGAPLERRPHPRLDAAYPVPNRPTPLNSAALQRLLDAVMYINSEQAVEAVAHAEESPRGAVVQMMLARQEIQRHEVRLSIVLEHSHGSMEAKCDALRDRASDVLGEWTIAAHHLVQPHYHLMAGQRETIGDVRALTARTSETANLLASAAVGRLLDRSEANRTTGAAVGAALAIIALISIFAALAAIPLDRDFDDYVSLAGWLGFGGVIVTVMVVALARLAFRPTAAMTRRRRGVCLVVGGVCAVACPALFAWGAIVANLAVVGAGAVAAVAALAVYAHTNNFA